MRSTSGQTDFPFPDVIRIEASGKCNFRCTHCPNGHTPSGRGNMSTDVFAKIIEQLDKTSIVPRVVVLYHGGEPLLNKNLPSYISHFKKRGTHKIKIVTNGSLLTEEIATSLDRSGLDELWVSFDGTSPEENDSIRCGGNFLRDSENVKRALSLKNRKMTIVITNVQIMSKEQVDAYISHEKQRYIPTYIAKCFSKYENMRIETYPAMMWPGLENCSEGMERYSPPTNEQPRYCSNLFETFTILSNGQVAPCCYDILGEAPLGNILEKSMFEIWAGSRHTGFRNALKTGHPKPLCKKCVIIRHEYLIRNAASSPLASNP